MPQDHKLGRPRTSLVDGGWEQIPNAIPDDTAAEPTVDSKELTSPDSSRKLPDPEARPRTPGPSALGLPPASVGAPKPPASRPGRPSVPPPPPSQRASNPPPPPSQRASNPPPSPSQRASNPPPARPSAPPPPVRPAPPAALVDTLSESLDAIVARAPEPPPEHSSLAPTQPSPTTVEPSAPTSIMPGPAPVAELPTLVEALGQRVQVAGGAGPLWAFALIAVALALASMALTSGSCSALIARSSAPRARPDHQPAPSATVAVLPSAPSPEAAKPETRERPAVDTAAIEARSAAERSVDDVLALSAARADEKRSGLVGAQDDPARLRAAVSDPDTMREALGAMARMSSPLGPDLLYSAWTTRKKGDPAAAIAEALLSTDEVRKRASPALLVALDLRAAESCDAAKAALGRAAEHGDRRVVPLLGRFSQKSGCGEGKRDDCWPCLREGDDLKTAAKAAGKRAPPKP